MERVKLKGSVQKALVPVKELATGKTTRCKGCNAKIVFGITAKNGVPAPVDWEYERLYLVPKKEAAIIKPPLVDGKAIKPVKRYYLHKGKLHLVNAYTHQPRAYDHDGELITCQLFVVWTPHFATCPHAQAFKQATKTKKTRK